MHACDMAWNNKVALSPLRFVLPMFPLPELLGGCTCHGNSIVITVQCYINVEVRPWKQRNGLAHAGRNKLGSKLGGMSGGSRRSRPR